jgi:hypothetical protein
MYVNTGIIKELYTVHLNNEIMYNTYNWKHYAKNGNPVYGAINELCTEKESLYV